MDKIKFSQLTLAAFLGGVSAISIAVASIAFLLPSDAKFEERGSGRKIEFIATESNDNEKSKQSTKIWIASADASKTTQEDHKPATEPPENPGETRRN